MIEQPPPLSDQHPLHLFDTLVYTGQAFNVWENAQIFNGRNFEGVRFTNELERSVGCLLHSVGTSFQLVATAFVVRYLPSPSTLLIDNSPVKALLLTAAHVYSTPLSSKDLTEDLFFSLSHSLEANTLNTYSKFRVQRLLAFNPFNVQTQTDPLLGYQYMVSQDVELLAVLEVDPGHQIAANGNDFYALDYQNVGQGVAGRNCLIIGYPARLREDHAELWAPIIGRDSGLRVPAENIGYQQLRDPFRAFSRGQIILANETCVAVNCSTWMGMSGSPICIRSQDGRKFKYCGVYNGSATMPFQALISKILFRLQGKNCHFTMDDIPTIPPYELVQLQYQLQQNQAHIQIRSKLLWVHILHRLIGALFAPNSTLTELITELSIPLRKFLKAAESFGINVQHNLGVSGGGRFANIIQCIKLSKQMNANGNTLLQFENLTKFDANPANPVTENQRDENLHAFLRQGFQGKRKKFLILTDDAYKLACELAPKLQKFIDRVKDHIRTIDEGIVNRKFEKIRRKFRKIFKIWIIALNR